MADKHHKRGSGGEPGAGGKQLLAAGAAIDDMAAKQAVARLRKEQAPKASGGKDSKVEDVDMIASMAKRLAILEKDLSRAQSKLRAAEDAAIEVPQLQAEVNRLKADSQRAWRQVAEMTTFLNDHGLVWVGEDAASSPKLPSNKASPRIPGAPPLPPSAVSNQNRPQPRPPSEERSEGQLGGIRSSSGRRRSVTGSSEAASSSHAADNIQAGASAEAGGGGNRLPLAPPQGLAGAWPPPQAAGASPATGYSAAQDNAPKAGLPFRMSDLLARVEELNQLAGDGCGQLVPAAGGAGPSQAHVLHTPEPVRLTVFRDGIQLHRQAARPFHDPGVSTILSDILDGYFPITLKSEFPDGVPIKVVDRLRDSYKEALSPIDHPAMRGAAGNVRTFHDLEGAQAAPATRDGFLSKLPQAVIKNGKVIDVRGSVGTAMGAPTKADANISLVPTHTDALLTTSQRNHKGPVLPPPSRESSSRPAAGLPAQPGQAPAGLPSKPVLAAKRSSQQGEAVPAPAQGAAAAVAQQGPAVTTLQVKSEDGEETLIVKLQYDDNIGALRKYIDAHRAKQPERNRSKQYEIRSSFPPQKYDDVDQTLRSAGLVPNATLFLRAMPSS